MPTEYILLRQRPHEQSVFDVVEVVEADQASQAVRRAGMRSDDLPTETFIAVPTRNWSVVTRGVEHPPPRITVEEIDTETFVASVRLLAALRASEVEPDITEDPPFPPDLIVTNVDDGPGSVPVHEDAVFHQPPTEEDPDGT